MEQERFSGEEPEKKEARRKRRGLDVRGFLEDIGFLEQRSEEHGAEAVDEDTERGGKRKRRKRIGEWLREKKEQFFGPLIPEPEFIGEEERPVSQPDGETNVPSSTQEENPLFAIAHEVNENPEHNEEHIPDATNEEQPSLEQVLKGLVENSDEATQAATGEGVQEQPIETYQFNDRLEDIVHADPETDSSYGAVPLEERGAPVVREPEARRVTDKRAVAVSVLLTGAERHARRQADREIEKKHEKELKEVRKELEKTQVSQEETIRTVRTERQPERAKSVAEGITYPEPVIPNSYKREIRPEAPKFAPPTPEFLAAQERQTRLAEALSPAKTPERPAIRPEIVLQQVEAAAEQNLPIEALYERRQEIKDEATVKTAATLKATGLGGGATSGVMAAVDPVPPARGGLALLRSARQQIADEPMYRQAVVSGMGTALVIIAGIIIIALFS